LKRILVADDSSFVRSSLADTLSERGFGVHLVKTRTELKKCLIPETYEFVIINLDIEINEKEDLLRSIRLTDINLPVAVINDDGALEIKIAPGLFSEPIAIIEAILNRNKKFRQLKIKRQRGQSLVISY